MKTGSFILAVDPGLATLGWAIVHSGTARVIAVGVYTSSPDGLADEWTDRVMRATAQAWGLRDLVEKYEVSAIAAEGVSCGGPPSARFSMGTSLCLSWGVLSGLAVALGVELFEVPPKRWQHAVVPEAMGAKLDYDVVFDRLANFVRGQPAEVSFLSIPRGLRNHACDAVGVGVFAALSNAKKVTPNTEARA